MQNVNFPGIAQPATDPFSGAGQRLEAGIRAAADRKGADRPAELEAAAREFESLFVAYILKTMRETLDEAGDGESGFGKGIYTELFDQEVSRVIARHGAMGIAELLIKGIESSRPADSSGDKVEPSDSAPAPHSTSRDIPGAGPGPGGTIENFQLPLQAPISSEFGLRTHPISGRREFHKGIDIAAPAGADVPAVLAGEVVTAGYVGGYGNTVVVRHQHGLETRYAHLASVKVKPGDAVSAQQVLGCVGSTGNSTAPHLHFEVTRRGERLNPRELQAE
jgi:murein DD-endopeptidase MepM/ murein hydrolase activator NlpD